MSVQVIGNLSAVASSTSSADALAFTTPPPAYSTGRRDAASALAAWQICFVLL